MTYSFTGRCGREGEMGYSILYPGYKRPHAKTDVEFKEFCQAKSAECLVKSISAHFPGQLQVFNREKFFFRTLVHFCISVPPNSRIISNEKYEPIALFNFVISYVLFKSD